MRDTLGTVASGAWSGGVIKAIDASSLPANASPRGLNTALAASRTGVCYVQKRKGLACLTDDPLDGAEAILGQHHYVEASTGIERHLCTTETQIVVKSSDGVWTALGTPLTSAAKPSFVTANNCAFLFNGTNAVKVRGTVIEAVGIVAPTVGTMAGTAGAAGLHNGTYELRVAFKNSNTNHISSASATASATVTVNNKHIDWTNVPVSADPQVDTRVLLVRNTATQKQFYVAGTIADNTTTTAETSILDENLLTVAPTRTNRNPPPAGVKYCTVYRGRLVVSDGEGIYWSRIDEPEAFDPLAVDLIDSSGDVITGLTVLEDTLLVLKDDRTFTITGELGGAYTVLLIDSSIGCVAHSTIITAGANAYWWSRHGIVKYADGQVLPVGLALLGDPADHVNADAIAVASAVTHEARGTIYWALPGVGQSRATFLLPYNYTLNVLESEAWDPMDAASLGTASDGAGAMIPTLGNYTGQMFELWRTNNDGVRSGTTTAGIATIDLPVGEQSVTMLSDPAAEFDIVGAGLLERKITVVNADGVIVGRRRITKNTLTELFFEPPLDLDITPASNYRYIVGGPNFQFDTPWRNFGDEWIKKRFEYLFLLFKGGGFGSAVTVTVAFDYDDINLNGKDRVFASLTTGAVFDNAQFDIDVWDTAQNVERRYRVARTGRAWRMRLVNAEANQPFALLFCSAQAVGQTVKA